MVVAVIAVIASAYPIVFLGRSLVSPNLGTTLLYDRFPTLPGYRSSAMTDPKLSDVGAVMWQHVPFSVIQHRALSQGELPLWNRYNALGVPIADDQNSLKAGARGPTLLEDFILREKIFHFDHERIPERVVHARGFGGFDLRHRRCNIVGQRVCHCLHRDRRIAADLDLAKLDLPGFAPLNHAATIKDRRWGVNAGESVLSNEC